MRPYLAVGIGGIIGTILRYLISSMCWMEQTASFPWSTYIVNVSGAFLLTFILFQPFFLKNLSPRVFIGLTTWLIGSYTTFSTLIVEIMFLWNEATSLALLYLSTTILGGLLASYVGYLVANPPKKREA